MDNPQPQHLHHVSNPTLTHRGENGQGRSYHARRAPNVSRCTVTCSYQDLYGPVLPRLDVFREVFVLERTRVLP